jgi:hypothetical protein
LLPLNPGRQKKRFFAGREQVVEKCRIAEPMTLRPGGIWLMISTPCRSPADDPQFGDRYNAFACRPESEAEELALRTPHFIDLRAPGISPLGKIAPQ